MSKKKSRPTPHQNFILVPPPAAPADAPGDLISAAQAALTRAAAAAQEGDLDGAERQSRLAERLDRIGRRAREDAPPPVEDENDGEAFRRELERRINRQREEERKELDDLKRTNPQTWQRQYEAALEKAVEDARRSVEAFWTGDPGLFEEPEGGYPPLPVK